MTENIDIKLVTFNIHGGYWDIDNIKPIYKLPLVVQYISNENLIFLQELGYKSSKYPRLNQTNKYQLQYLKEQYLKKNSGFLYSLLNERTGDAILSRFPIFDSKFHTVPRGEFRPFDTAPPAEITEAKISVKSGIFIHLIHCHFPHNGEYWEGAPINRQKDRIEASKICIDIIKQSPLPIILGGDLNAHIGDTEIQMISNYLTWSFYVVPKPSIDISGRSLDTYDTIDLILSRPNTYYGIFGPHYYKHIYLEENNGRVSDHEPIYVGFTLVLPDHKWVRCLFLDLLNRDPGSGGIFFDLLQKGTSKQAIVDGILNSPEHCTIVTNSLYQKYLERQSDPGGLQYYVNMLSHGTPIQNVIISICDSPEFKKKYPVPYEYTRALYNKILERAPEPGAVENNHLLHGSTTTEYIRTFLTSPEYASKTITSYYNKYLGRAPEPGAVEGGIPRLQNESLQQIIRGFLVSDEYQQRSLSRLP